MSGEWNAWETGSEVIFAPSGASALVMRSTASAGPDTTVELRPVHGGDSARRSPPHDGSDVVGGDVDGAHRAARRQLLHQPATGNHQSCRLVECQDLGERSRRELTHAVADQERRFDAEVEQRRAEAYDTANSAG